MNTAPAASAIRSAFVIAGSVHHDRLGDPFQLRQDGQE